MLYHTSLLIDPIGTALIPTSYVDQIEKRAGVFFWDDLEYARIQLFPDFQGIIYQIDERHLEDRVLVRPRVWKVTRPVSIEHMEVVEVKDGPEAPGLRAYIENRIKGT